MNLNFDPLKSESRLLLEAELRPVQGTRLQPTGFPDLGAATYTLPNGKEMLLVESAQSVANRLEVVCWDSGRNCLSATLQGLPYVHIDIGQYGTTNTLLEFHRLNSPYIWESKEADSIKFQEEFLKDLGLSQKRKKKGAKKGSDEEEGEGKDVPGVMKMDKFYKALFKYDPNSLIHGVFLEKVAGRLRVPRLLSGFIEAQNIRAATSGGVKFDRIFPEKDTECGITSKEGFTNVPFPRDEYTAEKITAYFNLDLSQLRGYGLGEPAGNLLIALALFKIQKFLAVGLRLRTACDLEVTDGISVKRPTGFIVPGLDALEKAMPNLIEAAGGLFAKERITRVNFVPRKVKNEKSKAKDAQSSTPEE